MSSPKSPHRSSPNSQSPSYQTQANPQPSSNPYSQATSNPYYQYHQFSQYPQMPQPPVHQFSQNSYFGYPAIPQNYYDSSQPPPFFMVGSSQPPLMRSSPTPRTPSTSVSESRPNINEEGLDNIRLQVSEETAPKSKQNTPKKTNQNTPRKSKSNARWNEDCNMLLISGWLNTSKDAITGTDQSCSRFWDRIAAYFNDHHEGGETRTGKQCKDHWNKMNQKVMRFNGCYNRALSLHHSGWSDEQIIEEAHRFYRNENDDKDFNLLYCWTLLRQEPKWNACYVPDSSKQNKVSESGAYTSSSNPDTNDEDVREVRPIGQKAAKRKGKGKKENNPMSSYETTFIEKLDRKSKALEKIYELEKKKLEESNKIEYMKYLVMDTSHMTEQQLIDHGKMCEYIRKNIFNM